MEEDLVWEEKMRRGFYQYVQDVNGMKYEMSAHEYAQALTRCACDAQDCEEFCFAVDEFEKKDADSQSIKLLKEKLNTEPFSSGGCDSNQRAFIHKRLFV